MRYTCFIFCLVFLLLESRGQEKKGIALLVGVDEVNDDFYSSIGKNYDREAVSGVQNDLLRFKRIVTDGGFVPITLQNASAESILDTMRAVSKRLQPDDRFLFYFSGHGDQVEDVNKDEESGYDQVLVTPSTYLLDDSIYSVFKNYFPEQSIVMIVDACHSGSSYKMLDFNTNRNIFSSIWKKLRYRNELKSVSQELIMEDCEVAKVQIDEPINLVYFGATRDEDVARGDYSGGLMSNTLHGIYQSAQLSSNWRNYDYKRLACELKKKLSPQEFQFHLLGSEIWEIVTEVPFKMN